MTRALTPARLVSHLHIVRGRVSIVPGRSILSRILLMTAGAGSMFRVRWYL